MIQIDVNSLAGVIIAALLSASVGGLIHLVLSVKKLIFIIGTAQPPDGLLGKVYKMDMELTALREWALGRGYERRAHSDID